MLTKTYGEVYEETFRLAGELKKQLSRFPQNAVIGLYGENSLKWLELFWAILICGCNPFLMNLKVNEQLLKSSLEESGAAAVLSDGKEFHIPTIKMDDIIPGEAADSNTWGERIWIMSSGTSQNIKLCAYRAEEFYYQICNSANILEKCPAIKNHFERRLKLLTFLPFYHIFGLVAVYIWFGFFSRTFVQLNDLTPQTLLNTIKRHKVTHIFAVPLFWETIYKQAMMTIKNRGDEVEKKFNRALQFTINIFDISVLRKAFCKVAFKEVRQNLFGDSIQFMISGGSFISEDALKFFNCIGYRLANGYGMTEVGITSVEMSEKKKYLLEGYVGSPFLHCEYSVDENARLKIRGKSTAELIQEKGNAMVNADWYETHDLVEEKEHHYRILGRSDDIIITADGENINPNLLEPRFSGDHISQVCIIQTKTDSGTVPVLLLNIDKYLSKEAFQSLDAHVKELMLKTEFPKGGKLYYTSTSLLLENEFKLNRKRLAEAYARGELVQLFENDFQKAGENGDLILSAIQNVIMVSLNLNNRQVKLSDDLFTDLGITSLEYYSLVAAIGEEFGICMPIEEQKFSTVQEIYDYIKVKKEKC